MLQKPPKNGFLIPILLSLPPFTILKRFLNQFQYWNKKGLIFIPLREESN